MNDHRDLSAGARSAEMDRLDAAIDQVAKRLTRVEDDAQFASRIAAALPDRSTWLGWLTHAWAPRLAMMTIIVMAAALWSARRTTEVPGASGETLPAIALNANVTPFASVNRKPLEPVGTMPLEPLEPLQPLEPLEPFTGLPPVQAPAALVMSDLAPVALDDADALQLPSLVIDELPLTAENFPQRD